MSTGNPAQRLRAVAIGLVVALLLMASWWLLAGKMSTGRLAVAAIVATPLLFALPRLWKSERRAYAWTTLAVVPYFVFSITEAVANPATRVWSATCLSMGFLFFFVLIAYLRATRQT